MNRTKKYEELARIAEHRVDQMMDSGYDFALENDINTAMEVLMDTVGIVSYTNTRDRETEGITPGERLRVAIKIRKYAGELMETALCSTNGFQINRGRFIYYTYRKMDEWIKAHDKAGNPVPQERTQGQ